MRFIIRDQTGSGSTPFLSFTMKHAPLSSLAQATVNHVLPTRWGKRPIDVPMEIIAARCLSEFGISQAIEMILQDAPFEFKGSGYRTDIAIFEPWRSKHMKKHPDRLLA